MSDGIRRSTARAWPRAAAGARRARRLAQRRARFPRGRADIERRLVWIMGSPRSGSTWLLNLMRVDRRVMAIDEPRIGMHLGLFRPDLLGARMSRYGPDQMLVATASREERSYFFSDRYEASWRPALRRLIVDRLGDQVMDMARAAGVSDPLAVIKEPHGSQVADMIMSTVPSSRLIFLVRDGRDVVDSGLDAATSGSWATQRYGGGLDLGAEERLEFIEDRSHRWVVRTEAVQRAYRQLPPNRRRIVRYEELRANPSAELGELVRWLDLNATDEEAEATAAKLSFEAVAEQDKGRGRFLRAATPGLWRHSMSADEQRVANEVMGPKLTELGYE